MPLAVPYSVIVLSASHHGPTVQPCTFVVARAKHAKTGISDSLLARQVCTVHRVHSLLAGVAAMEAEGRV